MSEVFDLIKPINDDIEKTARHMDELVVKYFSTVIDERKNMIRLQMMADIITIKELTINISKTIKSYSDEKRIS